jgi:hypothetical protein
MPSALCLLGLTLQLPAAPPMHRAHAYVCGLHFRNGSPQRQVVAHHFCSHGAGGLMQCVIYDSNREDARLIGIEYVLTAQAFQALPPGEKRLWHSHAYEVKSGLLAAPGMAPGAEQALMKDFATTYGKTWHTWQVERGDALPLGIPQLMMGFTGDGQADPAAVARKDKETGTSTEAQKRRRTELAPPPADPAADAWQHGDACQLELAPGAGLQRIPMH